MEDYDDVLSDHSGDEEANYSDRVDSDIEAELYGLIHHDTQNSILDISDSVEISSVSLQNRSSSTENNSNLPQNNLSLTNKSLLPLTNSFGSKDNTINSTKNQKNSVKKNIQNCSTPVKTDCTDFFSSDVIIKDNLYFSFESPVRKQKIQNKKVKSENSKRNTDPISTKRKSEVISEILGNIQLKKNLKTMHPNNNSISKQKKNKPGHSSIKTESFVEVIDDSSDSDSDSSIMLLEPDQSNIQTNIAKETVVLSSDSDDSISSMEISLFQTCQKRQIEISNANISPNNKDPWHINSEDMFRTKKQSNRYHDNAVLTCARCQLKGHTAKFCSVPKAMKCFFCGDFHSGMKCKNKICTRCFRRGHDTRFCYNRHIFTCGLCRMKGHSDRNCPDLWRRYHLTTLKGSIVKGNPNPHSPLYCYTCGSKGHYGAECVEVRRNKWSLPTWTSVVSYKNPLNYLRKENERILQQEESNYIQEERNSHERSRFDRTPSFHKRKGSETFSKDTPVQKSKKKKKKKTPKISPNADQQSTPRMRTIRNEVYFPRTPKTTPCSSREHFKKKKFKKFESEEDRILRQQVCHQIGLQERLGLSFPSTI